MAFKVMKLDKIITIKREWIEKRYTSTESWDTQRFRSSGDVESRG